MKIPLTVISIIVSAASGASAAVISWTSSPAVADTEVDASGTAVWAYAFTGAVGDDIEVNGVTFARKIVGGEAGGPMVDANVLTPGFTRIGHPDSGMSSFSHFSDEFYLGPNASLNQLLDGLTWGGTSEFQLGSLNPGTTYMVQLFSSDDRATWINRTLDLDSSWSTPDGTRQLEDVDYTAGGAWADPAGRSKIFTGTFTADATTQDILAALANGTGQIDLNAVQLRIVIPEPSGWLLISLPLLGVLLRRRR